MTVGITKTIGHKIVLSVNPLHLKAATEEIRERTGKDVSESQVLNRLATMYESNGYEDLKWVADDMIELDGE